MRHSFKLELAVDFSIELAIILDNLYFWISKNRASGRNYHDGRYWTYNSHRAFAEIFPYWNRYKISRILKQGVEEGLVVVGNYNKSPYDRTSWYSLTDKALSYWSDSSVQKETLDRGVSASGFSFEASAIPDRNHIENKDSSLRELPFPREDLDLLLEDFGRERVLRAMDIARDRDRMNMAYLKGILKNLKEDDLSDFPVGLKF